MDIQEALCDARWPAVAEFVTLNDKWVIRPDSTGVVCWNGLAVRIGVAYGTVTDEINPVTDRIDYRGKAVNLASRCESNAPHGSVNISEECYAAVKCENCDGGKLEDASFLTLPKQEMKGIGRVHTHTATRPRLKGRV
eukprot:gene56785-biopygen87432